MDSKYNYDNKPTNAQMAMQYKLQYGFNHFTSTLQRAWDSLSLIQKIVLVGIMALIIYFIIKLIIQQRKWASIKEGQTEPLFLSDLEWDSGGKKIYVGAKNPQPVVEGNRLPAGPNTSEYTYSFWLFMNSYNPFVPGADGAKAKGNITDREYSGEISNIFYRGNKDYDKKEDATQVPGVWFGGQNNSKLYVVVMLESGVLELITFDDFPINQWVNVTVVVSDRVVNVFFDGKLENTTLLKMKSKAVGSSYGLYIGRVGDGFPGEMAYLQYYNKALTTGKIEEIYEYYKRKIDDFMNNFNQWRTGGNLVPATPVDPICIPDDGSGSGSGSGSDGSGGFMSMWNKIKNDGSSMISDAKNEAAKLKSGAGGAGGVSGAGGKLKSDESNILNKAHSAENSAEAKLKSWGL